MKNRSKSYENPLVNIKIKISSLWITMMLLYIYADILSLFKPGSVQEMLNGNMGPFPATQSSILLASIMMIIPALMVFLTLVMKPGLNRITNICAGSLFTLVNIGNLIGETWIYYLLFGLIEILFTGLIIRFSWKWPVQKIGSGV